MRHWLAMFGLLVLCCCQTYNGGTCCARVDYCGGFIPGCFCAPQRCGEIQAP
jgi:hypothetical protein